MRKSVSNDNLSAVERRKLFPSMALHLSKSRFCSAIQCPKMLWLKQYKPEEFDDSVMNENVLNTGLEVGDLAMGLFGPYVEVPFSDLSEMVAKTNELLDAGTNIIAEASFTDGINFCSVDILIKHGDRKVEIYEVKSSTSVHDIYYYDAGYQLYVLEKCGYTVEKVCIVHVDNKYVRHGELELGKLFAVVDVTDKVKEMQPEIGDYIAMLQDYMTQTDEPSREIGQHCFAPYGCGFFDYCTRDWPHPNIFDIAFLQTRSKLKLMEKGIRSFEEVELNEAVKDNYMLQVKHELHDLPDQINAEAINKFMDTLTYPLYFLDFESFQPAIPLYDNSSPYEQIVFQYSLHYIEEENGELCHKEFLAYPGDDPRRVVAEHLCKDIPQDVCVLAYNMGFEKGRIKRLAELYPDLKDHLMNIHDNIKDLMVPFRNKDYYNRTMKGSYSIKYVLPALFPDDPSLDYHNLEGVHNGAEAAATFAAMAEMESAELEEYREHLLKYCELDTYAMVKIWKKINTIIGE